MFYATALALLLTPSGSPAPAVPQKAASAETDAVEQLAQRYLQALVKGNDPSAKSLLLGGVSLAAKKYTIPNFKVLQRQATLKEKKRIGFVKRRMRKLDKKGAEALSAIVKASRFPDDVTRKNAAVLLQKTRTEALAFRKDFPVFARVARVGKDVFWHPKNPWRRVIKDIGEDGEYEIELHVFRIEEREQDRPPRVWPLRVLRITTSKGYDSGYRVLPASDWDPDSI